MFSILLPLLLCPPAQAGETGSAGYDKGFVIESADGEFSLKTGLRIQNRLSFESTEGSQELAFSIPRARLKLSGHAYGDRFSYTFEGDWSKGETALKDYKVDTRLAEGLRLEVGQLKKPFERQQLTSSSKQEFIERAITDKAFGAGRELGLMFHNGLGKVEGTEWALGLFNGTGSKPSEDFGGTNIPPLWHPMIVGRGGWGSPALKGYSEADLEGGPARVGVALNGILDMDMDGGDDGDIRVGGDWVLKSQGFATTGSALYSMAQDGAQLSSLAPDQLGLFFQASYAIHGLVVPALRYARVAPVSGDGVLTSEYAGGLSVILHGHGTKWQLDGTVKDEDEAGTQTRSFGARTQLQFAI